jgi:hypothetical protein
MPRPPKRVALDNGTFYSRPPEPMAQDNDTFYSRPPEPMAQDNDTFYSQSPKRVDQDEDAFYLLQGVTPELDEFFEQERRRARIRQMQDVRRPRGRTTPVAVRFDQFTLTRLKTLAALRNTGYQTLLKEFVVERLYEEEKRAGIID